MTLLQGHRHKGALKTVIQVLKLIKFFFRTNFSEQGFSGRRGIIYLD